LLAASLIRASGHHPRLLVQSMDADGGDLARVFEIRCYE